ncbi:hypothetical protein [Trinickia acidisoli]|uniref:hypothetical protein n=1 Tax=Trinickia acidisoli TaxID=2767482 RepID=UPI001A902E66|nr:hypothetical protein [Trinickia acidisoli]
MIIRLDLDQENAGIKLGKCDNVSLTDDQSGKPIYMSSDFVADGDKVNNPLYFGSFDFMKGAWAARQANSDSPDNIPHPPIAPVAMAEVWEDLKKIWRLDNSKKFAVSSKLKSAFAHSYRMDESNLDDIIYWFIRKLFKDAGPLIPEAKLAISKNEAEFKRFLHYYARNLKEHHYRSHFDIFSQFFDCFDQFAQILSYTSEGITLPKNAKITSTNFEKAKKFYASAYEFYASAIEIITEINNILLDRPYDKLQNIDLAKFVITDKATRRNNLSNNTTFTDATKEFDHQIRNASFHNWFRILDDNMTIEYRSGGTGSIQKIQYIDYLLKCARLFHQVCELLVLEIFLNHLMRKWALVTVADSSQPAA